MKIKLNLFLVITCLSFFAIINKADAAGFKVTSPQKGDLYEFGDTLDIKWTPKNAGVKSIEAVAKDTTDRFVIYADKVYGYPTNYSGFFNYDLPQYVIVRPGPYELKFALENGSERKSKVFYIGNEGAQDGSTTGNPKYLLGSFTNVQKSYSTGGSIELLIPAFESKSVIAVPEKGFNIQAHLYKGSNTKSAIEAVNATYDYYLQMWKIKINTPNKSGTYRLVASLYCGNISQSSYCANKYGSNGQVEKEIKIKVVR